MNYYGIANFGCSNWINSDWQEGREPFEGEVNINGVLITGSDPGLTDTDGQDYSLLEDSVCIDKAVNLPDEITQNHDVTLMYKPHMSFSQRVIAGIAMDLGAFEYTGCRGDFDDDGDVDGSDLAIFAAGGTGITLEVFAADFGRTDCPVYE